ncbi:MAG TPA: 50S ribosomal protein L15 [Candidatus Omnitrophota bacterium]|nr:50S ribosomal protein L15 [Candidatus Omnitrophota bacterium]
MVLRIGNIGKPAGRKYKRTRVGRGIGSGHGKTAGKGHKGAKSRSGGGAYYFGFEGGQMPLIRRIPKRGFNNKWKKEWNILNLGTLEEVSVVKAGSVVDKEFLVKHDLIKKKHLPLKVLAKGSFKKSVTVKAEAFSESAKKAIEAAGGKFEIVK